jgi:hypothetical protein
MIRTIDITKKQMQAIRQQTHLTEAMILDFMRGDRTPAPWLAREIADVTNHPVEELFHLRENQ